MSRPPESPPVAAAARAFLCAACNGRVPIRAAEDGPLACPACGRAYRWDGGILVLSEASLEADYPADVYTVLVQAEPRHFWFVERNRRIVSTLRGLLPEPAGRSVLDVGCGTGFVLAALEREGMLGCGLDMHLTGLRYARKRTRGLIVCEGATRVPFAADFDVAMLCDVIEHVADDVAVLSSTSSALKRGGIVVITVPALPFLWTTVDEASGHHRRYTRSALVAAIQSANLRVELVEYFNSALLPVQIAQRIVLSMQHRQQHHDDLRLLRKDLEPPPAWLNSMFGAACRLDAVLKRFDVPGPSLIAAARRI